MKIRVTNQRSRKLKASARRASRRNEIEDYEYDEEPNMKLSRAFVIVLLLHVVAVGGIFAFTAIKPSESEQVALDLGPSVEPTATPSELTRTSSEIRRPSQQESGVHLVQAGENLTGIAALYGMRAADFRDANELPEEAVLQPGQRLRVPSQASGGAAPMDSAAIRDLQRTPGSEVVEALARESRPSSEESATASSSGSGLQAGGTYKVQSGDNPYSIARKHGVSYQDLLNINNIDDPRRLQIGQELIIPAN